MIDPFRIFGPAVVNFSGGRTSAYMLRRILDAHGGRLPADVHVLFCNTGREREETLDFVAECASRWGVNVLWLERDGSKKPGSRFREVEFETASRNGEPFAELIDEHRFLPNGAMRFCTIELKIRVEHDCMRSLGYEHWTSVLGLRHDEPERVCRAEEKETAERFISCPLYRAKVSKADVAAFWKSQPFDLALKSWEGNCDLCFMKGRAIRERIVRDRPDLAAWWIEQETRIRGRFHAHERGYAATLERVRRLPLLPMDLEPTQDTLIPCGCTDRRAARPRRCSCRKRPGQGHALTCVRVLGGAAA